MDKHKAKRQHHALEVIRHDLTPLERALSRVVHTCEWLHHLLATVLLRPNAMLTGAITMLVVPLALYALASYVGYVQSGSEWILAFLVGWSAGNLYDFLRIMITGKRQR